MKVKRKYSIAQTESLRKMARFPFENPTIHNWSTFEEITSLMKTIDPSALHVCTSICKAVSWPRGEFWDSPKRVEYYSTEWSCLMKNGDRQVISLNVDINLFEASTTEAFSENSIIWMQIHIPNFQ